MERMTRRNLLNTLAGGGAAAMLQMDSLWAQGELQLTPLADKLTLLSGAGGNIAILQGGDGLLMVDSGLPETAAAVETNVKSTASGPIKVLINTRWHFDHVGANVALGKEGVKIIANENVKKRLSTTQKIAFFNREIPPLAAEGLPSAGFGHDGSLVHGGEKVRYEHLPQAHTDGDSIVHFEHANVYHCGDLYFNGLYPFVDYSTGGSIEGMIASANRMYKAVDTKTKVIPGHGPIGTKADLKVYHDMLADVNEKVSKLIKEGKPVEQIVAAEPTKAYDEKWGKQFLKPADFVRMLYQGKAS